MEQLRKHSKQKIQRPIFVDARPTHLLQGDDVGLVRVALGRPKLVPQVSDHVLVLQDLVILRREHSLRNVP